MIILVGFYFVSGFVCLFVSHAFWFFLLLLYFSTGNGTEIGDTAICMHHAITSLFCTCACIVQRQSGSWRFETSNTYLLDKEGLVGGLAKVLPKSAGQVGIWNLILPVYNDAQMSGVLLFAGFCSKS